MGQLSNMILQDLRDPAQLQFLPLRVGGCSRPGPQRRQPPAQPCGMVRGCGEGAQHSPPLPRSWGYCIRQVPPPSPQTPCQLLPSLCCSSCWVLARISATWRLWASSSSCGCCPCPRGGAGRRPGSPCSTGACNRQEGLDPTSPGAWGIRTPWGVDAGPRSMGFAVPLPSASWKRGRPCGAGPSRGG